jgi:hypothetical protein
MSVGVAPTLSKMSVGGNVFVTSATSQSLLLPGANNGGSIYLGASYSNPTGCIETSWQGASGVPAIQIGVCRDGARASVKFDWNSQTTFFRGTAASVYISGSGNVGIGTTTPTSALHLTSSNNNSILVTQAFTSSSGNYSAAANFVSPNQSVDEVFNVNIGQALTARNAAYLGFVYVTTGSTSNYMTLGLNSVDEILNITGNGGVGIGTTSPSSQLDVITTNALGNLSLGTNIQNRKLVMYGVQTDGNQFYGFGINTAMLRYQVDATTSDHVFYAGTSSTNSNELLRVKGIGVISVPGSLTAGTLLATSSTISNIVASTSISSGTIVGTSVSVGNISAPVATVSNVVASTSLTTGVLLAVSSTIPNIVHTNISTGVLLATGNSNTLGNLFTTGGNIGIGTISPLARLHVGTSTNASGSVATVGSLVQFSGAGGAGGVTNIDLSTFPSAVPSARISLLDDGLNSSSVSLITRSPNTTTLLSRLHIASTGLIGINNTVPASTLHIKQFAQVAGGNISDYNQSGLVLEQFTGTNKWGIGVNGGNDLVFWSNLVERAYLLDDATVAQIDFTGQHRCASDTIDVADPKLVGYIVSASGQLHNISDDSGKPSINESLPVVELSNVINDKTVYGVISDSEDNSDKRTYSLGAFVSVFNKANADTRLIINSLGEGAIWVCNANGCVMNGDYITSSQIPGLGMKQDSDILHNYTVAKATTSVDFSDTDLESKYTVRYLTLDGRIIQKNEYNSETDFVAAFIGCTYHCG